MFLLDTDHVVVAQQQILPEYDRLIQRVRRQDPADFYVSVVSFHEQVMGWNAYISKAKDLSGVVRGYERLQLVLSNFSETQVLSVRRCCGRHLQGVKGSPRPDRHHGLAYRGDRAFARLDDAVSKCQRFQEGAWS
jgi:hypothetical protein